jgi:GT2 family glycosyltransferase
MPRQITEDAPDAVEELAGVRRALSETRSERESLLREIAALKDEADVLEYKYRTAAAELGLVRERLHAVENSLTWRLARLVLSPLDRLLGFSRWVKLFVRRGSGLSGAATAATSQDYARWVKLYDTLSATDREMIRGHLEEMIVRPLFSIVLPVFNTPAQLLRECLDSVLHQIYPRWELCIADDASTEPHCRDILREYAARDDRIKIIFREENGHISRASNSALELATGEYVVLLDHDDLLAEHALYMVAATISEHPEADVIYSDEDKINEGGRRYDPYFKPDFSPDLFLSQNFINHLGVYRTGLVQAVGGFRHEFVGSQDYDLALRVLEQTSPEKVYHIPFVLYHWRAISGSTALATAEKAYPHEAAQRAIAEHLSRVGGAARVEPVADGVYHRVVYLLPEKLPRVSLIVPSTCMPQHLAWCEELLEKTDYPDLEYILVANNLPGPEAREALARVRDAGRMRIADSDRPFNFSEIYNTAMPQASGEIIGILNDDLLPIGPNWLKEMVSHALRPEVGLVGAMLYYPDDTIQHAGIILGIGGVAGHAHKRMPRGSNGYFGRARLVQNFSAVTAACAVLRKNVFEEVGGLDPVLRVAFNDVDFCLRVRERGYRIVWTPQAELYHMESVTRGDDDRPETKPRFLGEMRYMQEKWLAELVADPYYNSNLSLMSEHFALAFPPRVKKSWVLADKGRMLTMVCVDKPTSIPREQIFHLVGWIASDSPILSAGVLNEEKCEPLVITERFDARTTHVHHAYVKGFEGDVQKTALHDGVLSIRFKLGNGEHLYKQIY